MPFHNCRLCQEWANTTNPRIQMNTPNPEYRIRRKNTTLSVVAILILGFSRLPAQTLSTADKDTNVTEKNEDKKKEDKDKEKPLQMDKVVVTGVFEGIKKQDATIAISTLDSQEIENLVPQSAASLLSDVPGVFVDSSHGEIRNVVFSRGVSANSLDGATGYYYVALEEDGLPLVN